MVCLDILWLFIFGIKSLKDVFDSFHSDGFIVLFSEDHKITCKNSEKKLGMSGFIKGCVMGAVKSKKENLSFLIL